MGTPVRSRYLPRSQTNRVGIVFELVELSQIESLQDFRVLECGKMYLSGAQLSTYLCLHI